MKYLFAVDIEHAGALGWPESAPAPAPWVPIEPVRCNLCDRVAVWRHSRGGFRCATCPRPEEP